MIAEPKAMSQGLMGGGGMGGAFTGMLISAAKAAPVDTPKAIIATTTFFFIGVAPVPVWRRSRTFGPPDRSSAQLRPPPTRERSPNCQPIRQGMGSKNKQK